MRHCANTLDDSIAIPQNVKHTLPYDPTFSPRHILGEIKADVHTSMNFHGSVIHSGQKVEMGQMPLK